jgi:hypothetical protein
MTVFNKNIGYKKNLQKRPTPFLNCREKVDELPFHVTIFATKKKK